MLRNIVNIMSTKIGAIEFLDLEDIITNHGSYKPSWLIQGLIEQGRVYLLHARDKAGKSTFTYSLAYHVQNGKNFMGLKTKQAKVLWVALEESQDDFLYRAKESGLKGNWTITLNRNHLDELDTNSPLQSFIKENGIGLLIIDPLLQAYNWQDPNDAVKVRNIFQKYIFPMVDYTGVSVLMLGHDTKARTSFNGSEQFASCCDGTFHLTSNDSRTILTLECRGRGASTLSKLQITSPRLGHYEIKASKGHGKSESAVKVKSAQVLPTITEHQPVSKKDLMAATNLNRRRVDYELQKLLADELITVMKKGRDVYYSVRNVSK